MPSGRLTWASLGRSSLEEARYRRRRLAYSDELGQAEPMEDEAVSRLYQFNLCEADKAANLAAAAAALTNLVAARATTGKSNSRLKEETQLPRHAVDH